MHIGPAWGGPLMHPRPVRHSPKDTRGDMLRVWKNKELVCLEWVGWAFMVPKPNGKWRLVMDYRWLNSQLRGENFPMPVIKDHLAKQKGNFMWTLVDLEDGSMLFSHFGSKAFVDAVMQALQTPPQPHPQSWDVTLPMNDNVLLVEQVIFFAHVEGTDVVANQALCAAYKVVLRHLDVVGVSHGKESGSQRACI